MNTLIINVDRFLIKGDHVAIKTKFGTSLIPLSAWEFMIKHEQHVEPEPLQDELEAMFNTPVVKKKEHPNEVVQHEVGKVIGNQINRINRSVNAIRKISESIPDFNTPNKSTVMEWVSIFNDPESGDTIKNAIVDRLMDISEECLLWTTRGLPAPVRAAIAQGRSIRLDDPTMGGSMMSDSLQLYAAGKFPEEVRGNPLVPPPAEINTISAPKAVVEYLNKVNANQDSSKAKALEQLGIGKKT